MSPAIALQIAIRQHLLGTPGLTALLGGPKIFDDVPQAEPYPYISFGTSIVEPLDGTDSRLDRHIVTLQVYSQKPGRTEAEHIVEALSTALDGADISLNGHRLVLLATTFKELRRAADGETRRGLIRLRATTEPLT